jgi:hemolysin activation/secretion protein
LTLLFWVAAILPGVAAAQPGAAALPRFDVLEYEVRGASLLPPVAIEQAVLPYLGPGRTLEDVESARTALERTYREAGYITVLVDIPEQKVDGGVVVLAVTEAPVTRTRVVGARYFSQGHILATAPGLAEGAVPYAPDVQEQLAKLNRSADRRVVPVLRPGRLPGTTEVDLQVEDRSPFHGGIELNNRYSPNTTPLRAIGTLRYDNLWQRNHSISLQYQTSPEDTQEVRVLSGSYAWPLEHNRTLVFYAVDSQSNVATSVAGTTVIGKGQIYGLRLSLPLAPVGTYAQAVTLGVDRKDLGENLRSPGTPGVQTPITYTPFLVSYLASRPDASGITEGGAGLVFSIRGLGNDEIEFENRRFKAQSNFLIFKWELARTQRLPRGFALYGRVDGQVANQPLVPNEQYVAGGIDNVRSYLEANALGDNAFHTTVELRTPRLLPEERAQVTELYALAFVDDARVTLRDPLPQQRDSFTLTGTGVGFRLKGFGGLRVRADVGYAWRDVAPTQAGTVRLQFVAAYDF